MSKEIFSLSIKQRGEAYEITGAWGGGDSDEVTQVTLGLAAWLDKCLEMKNSPGNITVSILAIAVDVVKLSNPDFAREMRKLTLDMIRGRDREK